MKKLKKGDIVIVLTGKDKGKTGKIVSVDNDRCIVENINEYSKAIRPNQNNKGGLVKVSMKIHVSNVQLFLGEKKIKVGFSIADGNKSRIDKNTKKAIS
jgi:large subunit ribosomal protein L24